MAPKSFTSALDGVEIEALSRYRPALPRSLYRTVYEYHTDAGASWFNAWDVVTGEGKASTHFTSTRMRCYWTSDD